MSLTATASRLLEKYGEPVAFRYETGGSVDPITGEVISAATAVSVSAYGYPSRYTESEVNGTTIQSGDIRLTTEHMASRPQVGWDVLVDAVLYRVMDVRPVRKTGVDQIYVVQLRTQ